MYETSTINTVDTANVNDMSGRSKITTFTNVCFEKVPQIKGRKLIRCSICVKYPNTVLLHTKQKNHIPAICSPSGTIPRKEICSNHLQSKEHIECLKAHHINTIPTVDKINKVPLDKLISAQNQKISQKIGQLMCTVFNDAKRGTISAWSWPSSEVAYLKRQKLDVQQQFFPFKPSEGELQYINPPGHREMIHHIVLANIPELKNKLKSCLSVSLRVDGSVDRFQIDNIHIMVKVITKEGNDELIFLGFEEPESRGAKGYYKAIKKSIEYYLPWDQIIQLMSSVVTDGASINVGEKTGLWSLLTKDRQLINMPLIKIWCAVHRSALAWEELTAHVIEVRKIIETCTSIATYFHQSGLRSKELKEIVDDHEMSLLHLPKYFEVRWTEFTYKFFYGVLKSWYILVCYFKKKKEEGISKEKSVSVGFLKFLTDLNKLKLLCFLTDLGYIYGRFQKQMQSDDTLIFDVEDKRNSVLHLINILKKSPLVGGWEDTMINAITVTNTTILLKGFQLYDYVSNPRRKTHHQFVTDNRSFIAIRNDILEHINNYIQIRLDTTNWTSLKPLKCIKLSTSDMELKECHALICPDLSLVEFVTSYREASGHAQIKDKLISTSLLKILINCPSWLSLTISIVCMYLYNNNLIIQCVSITFLPHIYLLKQFF